MDNKSNNIKEQDEEGERSNGRWARRGTGGGWRIVGGR
jgi:hypothetical protein